MPIARILNTFRGHVSEGFLLIELMRVLCERPCNSKVSETRLTISSN